MKNHLFSKRHRTEIKVFESTDIHMEVYGFIMSVYLMSYNQGNLVIRCTYMCRNKLCMIYYIIEALSNFPWKAALFGAKEDNSFISIESDYNFG